MNDKYIEISGVEQTFKTRKGLFCALQNINLTVSKGEFVTLIGHSGCGKSTLLNLLAGLTTPTQGHLLCANREIAGPGPERAVVFSPKPFAPSLADLFRECLPGCRARLWRGQSHHRRRVRNQSPALGPHRCRAGPGGFDTGRAKTTGRNFGRHEAACRHCPGARHGA